MNYCPSCGGVVLTEAAAQIRGERSTCVCAMTAERRDRALLQAHANDAFIRTPIGRWIFFSTTNSELPSRLFQEFTRVEYPWQRMKRKPTGTV